MGFGFSVACTVLGAMGPATLHWWLMRRDNERREEEWRRNDEVRAEYSAEELSDLGEHSPSFRYSL